MGSLDSPECQKSQIWVWPANRHMDYMPPPHCSASDSSLPLAPVPISFLDHPYRVWISHITMVRIRDLHLPWRYKFLEPGLLWPQVKPCGIPGDFKPLWDSLTAIIIELLLLLLLFCCLNTWPSLAVTRLNSNFCSSNSSWFCQWIEVEPQRFFYIISLYSIVQTDTTVLFIIILALFRKLCQIEISIIVLSNCVWLQPWLCLVSPVLPVYLMQVALLHALVGSSS